MTTPRPYPIDIPSNPERNEKDEKDQDINWKKIILPPNNNIPKKIDIILNKAM
jgi:hypothetical protein